jgi:SNF2 family DNA or RNA helicase
LSSKIKPFLLRREKTEILKELPAKIEQNSFFKLSDFQEKMYKEVLANLKKNVFEKVEKD